jgi:hypothetical protein
MAAASFKCFGRLDAKPVRVSADAPVTPDCFSEHEDVAHAGRLRLKKRIAAIRCHHAEHGFVETERGIDVNHAEWEVRETERRMVRSREHAPKKWPLVRTASFSGLSAEAIHP